MIVLKTVKHELKLYFATACDKDHFYIYVCLDSMKREIELLYVKGIIVGTVENKFGKSKTM